MPSFKISYKSVYLFFKKYHYFLDFFTGLVYNALVMKKTNVPFLLNLNLSKAPHFKTPYEEEILSSLSSGEIIMEVQSASDSNSVSKRVYITVMNEKRFCVQANLDSDGNLFHGWIDQGNCSHNLHPVTWNLIVRVLELTPDKLC